VSSIIQYVPHHAAKRSEIVDDLYRKILTGEFPPGSKLPSHAELAKCYNSCRVTAQHALRHPQQAGHVVIKARTGAFVVKRPPHLCNIAVAFGHSERESRRLQFHNILREEFERAANEKPSQEGFKWQVSYFYGN